KLLIIVVLLVISYPAY
ncbi:TPA: type I toxin-antitoxin system Ibs family toxin, partial [Escherichia coli]